jgi:hypothetical protein
MAAGQCRGRREAREAQPGGADDGLWSQGPAGRTPRRAEKIGLDEAASLGPQSRRSNPGNFVEIAPLSKGLATAASRECRWQGRALSRAARCLRRRPSRAPARTWRSANAPPSIRPRRSRSAGLARAAERVRRPQATAHPGTPAQGALRGRMASADPEDEPVALALTSEAGARRLECTLVGRHCKRSTPG